MKKVVDILFMNILGAFFSPLGFALLWSVVMLIINFFSPKPDSGWIGVVVICIFFLGVIIGLGVSIFEYFEDMHAASRKKKRLAKNLAELRNKYVSLEQAYDYFMAELALDREGTLTKKRLTEEHLTFIKDVKNDADVALIKITRCENQDLDKKPWLAPKGIGLLVRYSLPAALEYLNR